MLFHVNSVLVDQHTHSHTHMHVQVRCDVELEALRLLIENVHLHQAINRFVHPYTDWSETEKGSAGRGREGGEAGLQGGREGRKGGESSYCFGFACLRLGLSCACTHTCIHVLTHTCTNADEHTRARKD
jgi:hypothetical protein